MSAEQEQGIYNGTPVNAVLMLAVEEIRLPEITNVRPFSSKQDGEKELTDIQKLMTSIEQEGQIEPVVVMAIRDPKPGEPVWDLIAGRRRIKAIVMHNLASDTPLRVKAVISDQMKTLSQMNRRALHENLMREDATAIDDAHNIKNVRANLKLNKASDTKKVAEYFGKSEAWVTQTEKLLGLDDGFQQAIADGKLTREGAYALLRVKEAKRQDVYETASKKQKTELGELAVARALDSMDGPVAGVAKKPAAKATSSVKAGGVKAKHIKAAAREAEPESRQSRSKKDIVEYFESMMGPAYGYEDGAVWRFCGNLIAWIKGDIQDRTLDKYWDALVEKAPRGTPPPKAEKSSTTAKPKK